MTSNLAIVEELVRSISKNWFPNAGFSVKSLLEVSEPDHFNQTTVMIFQKTPDSKKTIQADMIGNRKMIIRQFLSIDDTFQNLINAEKYGKFTLGGFDILIQKDVGTPYNWSIEHIPRRNGLSYYGLDRPATVLMYSIGRSVQWQIPVKGIEKFDSLDDLIWFGLVAENGIRRPEYSSQRFKDYGLHLVVPHWHGYIDKIELLDKETIVCLGSDADLSIWKHILLSSKQRHDDGKFSPLQHHTISDDGTSKFENEGLDVRSTNITISYDPDNKGESIWIDSESAEKVFSENNYNLAIHQIFDPQSHILKSKLLEPGDDAQGFEWAIAVLMHIVGYRTEWWGYKKNLKRVSKSQASKKIERLPIGLDEVDLIAIDDDLRTILAIECTVSQGDISKKIEALAARAVKLKKELPWSKVILPVLCISLGREQLLAAGYGACFTAQVRIMSKDDYSRILDMVISGQPHIEIVKVIMAGSLGVG